MDNRTTLDHHEFRNDCHIQIWRYASGNVEQFTYGVVKDGVEIASGNTGWADVALDAAREYADAA